MMDFRFLKIFGRNNKRKNTIPLLYIMLFSLVLMIIIPSTTLNAVNNSNSILLKARQFTPEVAGKLLAIQKPRHAIIQFEGQAQQETLDALASQGVDILEYVPKNAVMTHIPANTDLSSITGIRWVGSLQPTDKLSSHLQISLDKGFVLVDVFPDITRYQAEEIIANAGGELIENTYLLPNTYLVRADEGVVTELSTADEVSWIGAASDAIIDGLPVYSCPGPMTAFGPVPNYVTYGDGWDGPGQGSADLTYHFENGTPDITGEEAEVGSALGEWTLYAAITWTETATSGLGQSIDILWGSYNHGDPYPFDGPGGVLAHAYYPSPPNSEPIAGDMHFDESETWNIGSNYDVFSVALHEAGHSLGLMHSSNPDAVMFAYYQMVTGLHQDDIDGIQSIYASCSMSFPDVSCGHWAEDYIEAIYLAGITIGYPDNTYRPENLVTRAQMAAFIIRALYGESFSYSSTPYFPGVSASHWAFKYVQKMYEDGITIGYGDGTYRPTVTVNRAQMAAFIIRALYGESFSYSSTPYFPDVSASHWAFKYVQRLYEDGITIGYGDGTYKPDVIVNRAQMAAFLARAFLGM